MLIAVEQVAIVMHILALARALLYISLVSYASTAFGAEEAVEGDKGAATAGTAPLAGPAGEVPIPRPPALAGSDQPVFVVSAISDEATVRVLLRGLDALPGPSDIEAGLLTSTQQPNIVLRPLVELLPGTAVLTKTGVYADLRIHGLVVFGESSMPLLFKGKQVESLRFSKPGLVAKPAGEGGFVARENSPLPLVLENPSNLEYKLVRARLRFGDNDVCVFYAERFPPEKNPSKTGSATCEKYADWTQFQIPRYAQVTLRADPAKAWFLDSSTGFARSGKQKGWLTLRFQAATDGPIYEQNLPLEIQFEPSSGTLFHSLLWVAVLLVVGALISLALRVSLPNIMRKRQLKDQLDHAAKLTASISTEVDSNLRVLLRVERLALDEIRQAAWPLGPSYVDFAQRVEQGLPTLKRRIDAVRRLDATLIRRKLLLEQGAAPTRLEQIESQLDTVSGALMQDELSEEDWVGVNQRLEGAQKMLREPSQTELEAFDAILAGRWKAIKEHFGVDQNGALKVPPALSGMEACFPDASLLPRPDDTDGSVWVKSVGPVRADLQLCALLLVWEFQFLAPANTAGGAWSDAKGTLNRLLATPAVDNLREAKSLLRQLAEGVSEESIVTALKEGRAMIVMDPSFARPHQKIRFSVRFRYVHLNIAAARELVTCRWSFVDQHASPLTRARRGLHDIGSRMARRQPERKAPQVIDAETTVLSEDGWRVHHYFEKDVEQVTVSLSFYDSKGQAVDLGATDEGAASHWSRLVEPVRVSRRPQEQWARFWLEAFQLFAALLIPLATLASTTISGGSASHWWGLVAIGFGSDTIKSVLVGQKESSKG